MVTAPVPDSLTQCVGSSVFEAVTDRKQPHRDDTIIIDDQPRIALNDFRTLLIQFHNYHLPTCKKYYREIEYLILAEDKRQ